MAARGSVSKEVIMKQILDTFTGAFKYGKDIRIPMIENGETVQIKITLTAAKENVECGGDVALPNASSTQAEAPVIQTATEPTAQEKETLQKLVASMF